MEAKPGASAEDLSALPDATVDVVTTRSMLIYVAAKRQAFAEFSASYHLR
jgi:ubiquinone/menaquinone biosynthesis C-methylase UbiE